MGYQHLNKNDHLFPARLQSLFTPATQDVHKGFTAKRGSHSSFISLFSKTKDFKINIKQMNKN